MKKQKTLLKLWAILLLISTMLIPQEVWAISGSGTSSSPYIISNESDWDTFRSKVNDRSNASTQIYAKLDNDITITKGAYTPVGTSGKPFYGEFNGNGKTITLEGATTSSGNFGLFGYVSNATIQNLRVAGTMTVSGTKSHIGGIVGYLKNASTIKGCTFSGTLDADGSSDCIGGIVGFAESSFSGSIINCFCNGTLKTTSTSGSRYVGGILGYFNDENSKKPTIQYNFSDAQFKNGDSNMASGSYTNGIIGRISAHADNIMYNTCIANGNVSGAMQTGNTNATIDSSNKAITISAGTGGTISSPIYINPTSTKATQVKVTATPNSDYHFKNWSGSSTSTSTTVTATLNNSLTANFETHSFTTKSETYLNSAATCEKNAYYYYVCSKCNVQGTTTWEKTGTKLGHSWASAFTTDKEATCTENGSKSKHCTRSGCYRQNEITVITALGHNYNSEKSFCDRCDNGFLYYTASEKMTPYGSNPFGPGYIYKEKDNTYDSSTKKGEISNISKGVEYFEKSVFSENTKLTSISIPSTLYGIENYAFDGCTNLNIELTIPGKVRSIGTASFQNCNLKGTLKISESVKTIGGFAFAGNVNITKVYNYATTPQSINENVFSTTTYGKTLYVPSESIDAYKAATGWKKFKTITCIEHTYQNNADAAYLVTAATCTTQGVYKKSCKYCGTAHASKTFNVAAKGHGNGGYAGSYAWSGTYSSPVCKFTLKCKDCNTTVVNAETLTGTSGTYGNYTCDPAQAATYTADGSQTYYGHGKYTVTTGKSFSEDGKSTNYSHTYTIPKLVCTILRYTATSEVTPNGNFYDKNGNKLTYTNTFDSETGEGKIEFNGTLTSIGNYAFDGCSNLASLTIPNSVTSIGKGAFYGCSSLTSVSIPNSVTSIGNYAFCDCSCLTNVTIPNSVTNIGDYAFSYCSSLTNVIIPNSVTSIGDGAFQYCCVLEKNYVNNSGLEAKGLILADREQTDGLMIKGSEAVFCRRWATNVNIPNSVTAIGNDAFMDCSSLTSMDIPNSVTSIGYQAFYGCSSLASITIPNSVTSIGDQAFYGCSSLESISISNSVTSIRDGAFNNCSSLTNVTIPSSVTTIGNYAFFNCSKLTSVSIPNSVTSIGNCAFAGCSKLTNVTIPNSVTSIGNYAFENCSKLTNVTIPNSVTSIGNYDFSNCSKLTSVTIPNSVKSIGNYAFENCSSLSSVKFQSIPEVYYNAFDEVPSTCKYTLALSDDSYVAADKDCFPTLSAEPTYSREMSTQWGTIVVPFDVTIDVKEPYDFYELESLNGDVLSLKKVTGTLAAGTPVLIRMSGAKNAEGKYILSLTAADCSVSTGLSNGSSADGLTLTGAYAKKVLTTASGYIINNNSFWSLVYLHSTYPDSEISIGAFRAYLAGSTSGGAAQLRISAEEATALEVLDSLSTGEALEVFDLNGRRQDDLRQGVNIIKKGNKSVKVIVK